MHARKLQAIIETREGIIRAPKRLGSKERFLVFVEATNCQFGKLCEFKVVDNRGASVYPHVVHLRVWGNQVAHFDGTPLDLTTPTLLEY